jgi:hypothetical protein
LWDCGIVGLWEIYVWYVEHEEKNILYTTLNRCHSHFNNCHNVYYI